MSNNDRGWADKYFAAWGSGDTEAVVAFYTDDAVVEDVPSGHVARGRAEVEEFVRNAIAKTPGTTYETVSSHVDGDAFFTEWVMQPAGIRGSSAGTLRDGRIASNRDYWDTGAITK